MKAHRIRWRALALAVGAAALLAAGCGGDSDEESATAGGGESTAAAGPAANVQAAQERVDAALKGTFREPPSDGPAAQRGKKIYAIPCTTASIGCAKPALALEEAGKELGWEVTVVDGKADPGVYTQAIKQAIAAGADGIMTVAIDCPSIKAALQQAKKANVPVVGAYAFDCDDPSVGEEPLYAAVLNYGEGHQTPAEYYTEWGRLAADYVIAKTDGKAKIINLTGPAYKTGTYKDKGFKEELEKNCPDCEIVEDVEIPPTGPGGPAAMQQKARTALQRHPDANVMHIWADTLTVNVAEVIRPLKDKLLVVGGEGLPENMNLIKQGVQDAAIGVPSEWFGWAAADQLNRLIAGETEMPDQGLGHLIVDAENNVPTSKDNALQVPVDFKAGYKKLWGGSN